MPTRRWLRYWHPALSSQMQNGFTLMEILVVITLTVIVMVAAAGLFYTTLISNTKKNVLSTVKDEGDYALSQMEFLLRNAVDLVADPNDPAYPNVPTCQQGMTKITLKSADEGITSLYVDANGRIASKSASLSTPSYLTTDGVTIPASGLVFNCTKSDIAMGTYVTITFALEKTSPDLSTPTTLHEDFSTSVTLRNL